MSVFRWFFTRKCPQCGKQLDKGASACRHCGCDNPQSWRQCMACGVSVAADSAVCWKCKASLLTQPRDVIFGDRWKREPGVFAMRVPIETPQERLRHGIQVDEGMRGALYRNGVFKEALGPGYHTMTSFWQRLTGGDQTGDNIEAIVATADPVTCTLTADETAGIMTAGYERVTFVGVSLEVELADLQRLQTRFLPYGSHEVAESTLLDSVRPRLIEVLRGVVRSLTVEQLSQSLGLRRRLEADFGRELPPLLESCGLRLCAVHDVILEGPAIQRLHGAEEQISSAAREAGWEKRLRDIRLSGELSQFRDDLRFREQVDIWTHDYNLSEMDRRHLAAMRGIEMDRQRDLAAAEARGQVAKTKARINIDIETIEFENDMKALAAIRAHQKEMLGFLDGRKHQDRDKELERDLLREQATAENEVKRARAFAGLRPEVVAGIVSPERGAMIAKALEAARPYPAVTVQPSGPSTGTPMAAGTFEALAQRYFPCVGVIVTGFEIGGIQRLIPRGTVWVPQGRNALATNAHVAKSVADDCRQGAGAWVLFSGSTAAVPVTSVAVHSLYGSATRDSHPPIPAWDVALIHVAGPLPGPGLPMASDLSGLTELQPVAYIGFPMEGLAGGGVNLEHPKAIAKRGSISALQDWHLRNTPNPAERMLIAHDLGVAGGASGSPLFDAAGLVIGIISAGNMDLVTDPESGDVRRIPNGALLNYAQRIDALTKYSAAFTTLWQLA